MTGKIVVFVVSKDGLTEAQQTLPNGIPSNDPSLPDLDTPLYVLVNSNTASAAEVLAAALKVRYSAVQHNTMRHIVILQSTICWIMSYQLSSCLDVMSLK